MDHRDDPTSAPRSDLPGEIPPPGERHDGAAERVEDYLRLEEHVEQLQADRRPRRPRRMSPQLARVYQMAALFRSAGPNAAEPDPAFAARLRAQLEREVGGKRARRLPMRSLISRRGLLASGLGAAAAAAAGVAAGMTIDRTAAPPVTGWSGPLVPGGRGRWVAVVAADAVPVGAVFRFATEQVVGFVRHTQAGYEALSGACTHMGCLLAWNGAARTFDCPCHGGRFAEDGRSAPSSPVAYRPLPSMQTHVEAGQVWVYVPATGAAAAPAGSPDTDNPDSYGRRTPAVPSP
jgi:cytochrome b6-f complex iron-sulfur subunit